MSQISPSTLVAKIDSVAKLYEKAARAAQQFGSVKATLPRSAEGFVDFDPFVRVRARRKRTPPRSVRQNPRVWPTAR